MIDVTLSMYPLSGTSAFSELLSSKYIGNAFHEKLKLEENRSIALDTDSLLTYFNWKWAQTNDSILSVFTFFSLIKVTWNKIVEIWLSYWPVPNMIRTFASVSLTGKSMRVTRPHAKLLHPSCVTRLAQPVNTIVSTRLKHVFGPNICQRFQYQSTHERLQGIHGRFIQWCRAIWFPE